MGAAAPSILQMSIAPFEAQKRAQNLGAAESTAVTFAATNEGASTLVPTPHGCTVDDTNAPAYEITCDHGTGKYVQTVSRSFRLNPGSSGGSQRTFPITLKKPFGLHQCNAPDEWGIGWAEDWPTLDQCLPQVAWDEDTYFASNPDEWPYDINNIRGFGNHPDY